MAATQVTQPTHAAGEIEVRDGEGTLTYPFGRVEVLGPHASLYVPVATTAGGTRGEKLGHIYPARQTVERHITTYRGRDAQTGVEVVWRVDTSKGCADCG